MSETIEVRKLPKKTITIIVIMTIIMSIGFLFMTTTKNMKMEEVLGNLGHKNISGIKVINKMSVEDKKTRIPSTVYKVVFTDKDLQKECIGFVHKANRGEYSKDIDCK